MSVKGEGVLAGVCVCDREREREYEGADHNHGNIVRGHKGERARERCLTEGFEGLRNIQCVNENAWHALSDKFAFRYGGVSHHIQGGG